MRRSLWGVALLALAAAAPLCAQELDENPQPGRAGAIRRQIEDRFAQRVQEELALTNDQARRLRQTVGEFTLKRRGYEAEQLRLRQALAFQLRPGIAADQDSVERVTRAMADLRIAYAQTYRDELRAMTYLTPVQRAQFFVLRERLLDRAKEIREGRQGTGDAADTPLPRRRLLRP